MRGHEYVKACVLTYLQTAVPVRLGMLRTALAVTSPVDPAAYSAADSLTVSSLYPLVLVRSTSVPALQAASTPSPGVASTWVARYQLEVVVACDSGTHGDYDQACTDRDRLLLAVREALLLTASVGTDVELQHRNLTEQTGAAAETLQGRPLAAGSITLQAAVVETLQPSPDEVTEDADAFDSGLYVYSANQSIP